jgi:hypothetical protein
MNIASEFHHYVEGNFDVRDGRTSPSSNAFERCTEPERAFRFKVQQRVHPRGQRVERGSQR